MSLLQNTGRNAPATTTGVSKQPNLKPWFFGEHTDRPQRLPLTLPDTQLLREELRKDSDFSAMPLIGVGLGLTFLGRRAGMSRTAVTLVSLASALVIANYSFDQRLNKAERSLVRSPGSYRGYVWRQRGRLCSENDYDRARLPVMKEDDISTAQVVLAEFAKHFPEADDEEKTLLQYFNVDDCYNVDKDKTVFDSFKFPSYIQLKFISPGAMLVGPEFGTEGDRKALTQQQQQQQQQPTTAATTSATTTPVTRQQSARNQRTREPTQELILRRREDREDRERKEKEDEETFGERASSFNNNTPSQDQDQDDQDQTEQESIEAPVRPQRPNRRSSRDRDKERQARRGQQRVHKPSADLRGVRQVTDDMGYTYTVKINQYGDEELVLDEHEHYNK